MADPRLNEARALKGTATALRNRGEFQRAQQTLDEAIRVLETPRPGYEVTQADAKELRAELADTFGMKAGIFRRMGELDAAFDNYSKGREIEVKDEQSTYNLSNVITLSITRKGLAPTDPAIRADLKRAIKHLEAETAGPRIDEFWAWSDLAQFHLLNGALAKARACYATAISKTGPTAEEIKRHSEILEELEQKTATTAPEISASIRAVINEFLR